MTFLYHKFSEKFPRNFSGKVPFFFPEISGKILQEISQLTTLDTGNQLTGDIVMNLALRCHYFPPELQLPSN